VKLGLSEVRILALTQKNKIMSQIIYQALYCPCIHESSSGTLSLHKTKEGAEKAVEAHKALIRAEWVDWGNSMCGKPKPNVIDEYKTFAEFEEEFPFAQHESWDVSETELLD
jgi:hypothetical protein